MTRPRLTISVGGGGVGKTTTSAALAVAMARGGARTLVITVDPARRLADALGIQVGQATRQAPIDPRTEGRLYAKMPDPRESIDDFMTWLFVDEAQRRRVTENPAYAELSDSLAGVHELLTIGLLQNEIDSGLFDEIVLDTAPSRHALSFLTYPSRLLELLEAKALSWLSNIAEATRGGETPKRGLLSWGRSKVEGVFGRLVGASAVRNLSALFGELASVRGRWAELARRTELLLGDPRTRYLLVGAPSGGAIADIAHLSRSLARRKLAPTAIVLNRAEREPPACEAGVRALLDRGKVEVADEAILRETLDQLAAEHRARKTAAGEAVLDLETRLGKGTRILRLPFVGPAQPNEIVLALADAWAEIELLSAEAGALSGASFRRDRRSSAGSAAGAGAAASCRRAGEPDHRASASPRSAAGRRSAWRTREPRRDRASAARRPAVTDRAPRRSSSRPPKYRRRSGAQNRSSRGGERRPRSPQRGARRRHLRARRRCPCCSGSASRHPS